MKKLLVVAILLMVAGCASRYESLASNEVGPCPAFPGCARVVWETGENTASAWQALGKHLQTLSSFTIVEQSANYIEAEARTRVLGFIDDVQFQREGNAIVGRSSSRIGLSDLGKNRQRLDAIAAAIPEFTP